MPELPEVETVVCSLAPVVGRRIEEIELTQPRVVIGDRDEMIRRLRGAEIRSVERRGKFIVMRLGEAGALTVHLGMTGRLLWNGEATRHTHAVFTTDRGTLIFDDPRQFGRLEWSPDLPGRVARLGPDALTVPLGPFIEAIRSRTARIKSVLLNQFLLGGLGNIYVDESLHRAGIHPATRANRVSRPRLARLHAAIGEVLREAIAHGGSSISDYMDSEGNRGSFQDRHRVYGRPGLPCGNCGTLIRRTVIGQRGTHFCPKCQKR